jgi:hypothetical protein
MVRLALTALVLAGSVVLRTGFAQESPLSDAWKGDKLDAKWHVTVLGDAQDQESSIKVENGALRIRGGGSDIWGNNDNGIFIWQPANGDFQVTLEMRGLKRTDPSAKVGIMVRSSLDRSAVNTFLQGMPKGGALQSRLEFGVDSGPGSGCPGADCNPWGDPDTSDLVDNPMPTILQRLTRIGKNIKAERSYDGGKTWVGLRKGSLAERDVATIDLPDDVLVGIGYTSHNSGEVGEALLGPITFVQTAARPTDNGLIAGLAVDANGKPVPDVNLVVKKGNDVIGRSGFDDGDIRSNTASFFLKPGAYTIETAESDVLSAGTPVPFEIKTGQVVDLKVVVGKAK